MSARERKTIHFLRIFFILFLLSGFVSALDAREAPFQKVTMSISWATVKGNNGYIIEVKDERTGNTQEYRTKTESAEIELAPGQYQLRLAALNKFSRPSRWTSWNPVSITGESQKQSMVAEKEKKVSDDSVATSPYLQPTHFIPGLTRMTEGAPFTGGLWAFGFLGLTAITISEGGIADRMANEPWNRPGNLAILLYDQPLESLLYARQIHENHKQLYNRHKQNQAIGGATLLLFYGMQYVDAVLFETGPETGSVSLYTTPSVDGGMQLGLRVALN